MKPVTKKHFKWNRRTFNTVLNTLQREAQRLSLFTGSCPQGRVLEIVRLRRDLKSLINLNPPNYHD